MQSHRQPVSPSAEEYLLTLFRHESIGEALGTNRLARLFGVKAPSVTGMLRRLRQRGWVWYQPYRPPSLTEEGRRVAVRLIRRHRLLETYLVEVLGFPWDRVHEEVQILEHAVSEQLMERIADKLGHPSYDPHGDPIPDAEGNMPETSHLPVGKLPEGGEAVLSRVDNRRSALLAELGDAGAFPGVRLRRMADSEGALVLRIGEKTIHLSQEAADLIWVSPA